AGMEETNLAGEHALTEPSVARAQHCSSIGAELRGDTEARREYVPRVQGPEPADEAAGFIALRIERRQILTDGAAVVEPQSRVDGQPIPQRYGIARERGCRDRHAAGVGGRARDRLQWPSVAVDKPHAARNDRWSLVFAPLELSADLPLVIGAQQSCPIVTERRFRGRANQRERAESLRSAAQDACDAVGMVRGQSIATARVVGPRVDESSDAHVPQRPFR